MEYDWACFFYFFLCYHNRCCGKNGTLPSRVRSTKARVARSTIFGSTGKWLNFSLLNFCGYTVAMKHSIWRRTGLFTRKATFYNVHREGKIIIWRIAFYSVICENSHLNVPLKRGSRSDEKNDDDNHGVRKQTNTQHHLLNMMIEKFH